MKSKFYASEDLDVDFLENELKALGEQEYYDNIGIVDKAMRQIKKRNRKRKKVKATWTTIASAACLTGFLFFGHVHRQQVNNKLITDMMTEIYVQEDISWNLTDEDYLLSSY